MKLAKDKIKFRFWITRKGWGLPFDIIWWSCFSMLFINIRFLCFLLRIEITKKEKIEKLKF